LDWRVTTPNDTLRFQVRIDAPADAVFRTLTDTDLLIDWLAESADVSLDDSRYEFWGRYAPQGDRARQRLLAAEPGRLLNFSWEFDGSPPSVVAVTLEPHDGGDTVVRVEHSGVPTAGPANPTALHCFWHVSLANLAAYCESLPTMPPFDFSVPAQGDALLRTVIDVPPDEVFASLLDPAQVDRWAGGEAVIEPKVGGRYDFGWDHGPVTILELEQDKVLAYSWRYPDSPETVVRWALRGARGSTYLTLMHSGFDRDELAEQFRQGWPGYLVEVKRMLELGDRWEPINS
jgi:uncharacterized protein YndB with AHSA1/START domain